MFHIIEVKSNKWGKNSAIVTPIPSYEDYDKAVSAFYYKMVYASDPELSQVDIHSVSLIDHTGETLMHQCCSHAIEEDN